MQTAGQSDRSTQTAIPGVPKIAERYDVVLIGGGPAGSALATLLARADRRAVRAGLLPARQTLWGVPLW